ncbi:MAG: YaeQ family protein [Candidatus Thiodiazotropha sp.]
MALKATIFKAEIQISDMDRNHYQSYPLTLARHPSETDERMLLRVVAFALNAHERLTFCKGISTDDEPDLWQKSLSDEIELWIELGQPDEKRLRRACGRAGQVMVYPYAERSAAVWWQQNSAAYQRFENLSVMKLTTLDDRSLSELAQKNMELTCTIQEGEIWLSNGTRDVTLEQQQWK